MVLAVKRTEPARLTCAFAKPWERFRAACSICRADSATVSAMAVGRKPRPVRSKRGTPNCASNSAMCLPRVGWLDFSALAAPSKLPCSNAARKLRTKSQSKTLVFIIEILL